MKAVLALLSSFFWFFSASTQCYLNLLFCFYGSAVQWCSAILRSIFRARLGVQSLHIREVEVYLSLVVWY